MTDSTAITTDSIAGKVTVSIRDRDRALHAIADEMHGRGFTHIAVTIRHLRAALGDDVYAGNEAGLKGLEKDMETECTDCTPPPDPPPEPYISPLLEVWARRDASRDGIPDLWSEYHAARITAADNGEPERSRDHLPPPRLLSTGAGADFTRTDVENFFHRLRRALAKFSSGERVEVLRMVRDELDRESPTIEPPRQQSE